MMSFLQRKAKVFDLPVRTVRKIFYKTKSLENPWGRCPYFLQRKVKVFGNHMGYLSVTLFTPTNPLYSITRELGKVKRGRYIYIRVLYREIDGLSGLLGLMPKVVVQ